ncbi:MAG: carbohydrate ABC transporter permease [Angelakisella sp.]
MENIRTLFDNIDFMRSFWNTVYVASITTALVVFVCSLAGFTFAKFKFPGKKFLFVLLMSTMMIPSQLSLVPNFIIMQKLGWINDFKAIIVPSIASAFGIFWVRQFTESAIHDDLLNAGRIDGCNDFQLYSKIGFPIITPATSFLAIFTFMGAWNNYLWPMIVMSDSKKYILQVALAQLNGIYKDTNYAMVMAGTLLATIPLVIIFLLFSKKFMEGVADGAIKG